MPKTLINVINGLVAALAGWQPTTSLVNDIADGIILLNTAHTALPASPLINAIFKTISGGAADLVNLESGQLALVGSHEASFSGADDEVLVFAVRKYKNGGAPAGSPAEQLKTLNGY